MILSNRRCLFIWCLLFALLLLSGCQARETSKALTQADQATEAIQRIAQSIADMVNQLPPELQELFKAKLEAICILASSARDSMRPARTLTNGNEPPPRVDTTVDLAAGNPHEFSRQAAIQTGKAQVEVEGVLWYFDVGQIALNFGKALTQDWLTIFLTAIAGCSGTGAVGLKLYRVYSSLKNSVQEKERAARDAVAYGNDMSLANSDTEAAEVIRKHKAIQKQNGTNDLIKKLGALPQEKITPLLSGAQT